MKPIVVVKIGGNATKHFSQIISFMKELLLQKSMVLVHGGGPQISQALERIGHTPTFKQGLRVTDSPTLDIAVQILAGSVNKGLVAELEEAEVKAAGVCGIDGGTLKSEIKDGGAWGHVGDEPEVDPSLLNCLLEGGYTPVVSPLGLGPDNQLLNINADTTASALAVALKAQELLFLTDVPGVLDATGSLIAELDSPKLQLLTEQKVVNEGMLPKLRGALKAANSGVSLVRIASPVSDPGTVVKKDEHASIC